jgi:hypothetical protein
MVFAHNLHYILYYITFWHIVFRIRFSVCVCVRIYLFISYFFFQYVYTDSCYGTNL